MREWNFSPISSRLVCLTLGKTANWIRIHITCFSNFCGAPLNMSKTRAEPHKSLPLCFIIKSCMSDELKQTFIILNKFNQHSYDAQHQLHTHLYIIRYRIWQWANRIGYGSGNSRWPVRISTQQSFSWLYSIPLSKRRDTTRTDHDTCLANPFHFTAHQLPHQSTAHSLRNDFLTSSTAWSRWATSRFLVSPEIPRILCNLWFTTVLQGPTTFS